MYQGVGKRTLNRIKKPVESIEELHTESINQRIQTEFKPIVHTISEHLNSLNMLMADPLIQNMEKEGLSRINPPLYRHSNHKTKFQGKKSPITVEYTVTNRNQGFLWWKTTKKTATLYVSSEFDLIDGVNNGFTYDIPKNNEFLNPKQRNFALHIIESLVIDLDILYTPEESKFLKLITKITGSAELENHYHLKRYRDIAHEIGEILKEKLEKISKNTEILLEDAQNKLKSLDFSENLEKIQTLLNEEKEKILEQINKDFIEARSEIEEYKKKQTKNFLTKQNKRLKEIEIEAVTEFASKVVDLEKKEKSLESKYKKLQSKLETKEEELDRKLKEVQDKEILLDSHLEGRREKVIAKLPMIGATLSRIFPDTSGRSKTYTHKVNHYLRMFYQKKIRDDLSRNQYADVENTLQLLEIIRRACFNKNRKPEGRDIREIYTGVRAVLHYVIQYEVDFKTIVTSFKNKEQRITTPKPGVEEFVESLICQDYDFNKFRRDLHKLNAQNKRELGIK